MIRRSSERHGDDARNGAAIAIGCDAMKRATAGGTFGFCERAATA